jgi:CheY-like chemotaxis protein
MHRSPKVLIVEDQFIIAEDIKYQLNAYGYEAIFPVFSGEEAIQRVRSEDIDIILMDIQLAGVMDGIDTAEIISKFSNASIIFITGNSDQVTTKRALEIKPANFLTKPLQTKELIKALDIAMFQKKVNSNLLEVKS